MSFPPGLCVGMESIMGGFANVFNKPSRYVIPAGVVRGMESIMGGFAKIKDQKNQSPT